MLSCTLLSIESNATYKSQLLVYAQRRSKQLPEYTAVRVGSPHAPQFKATVVIDGLTFECPRFFKTVREAEHAAAEVALANLPKEESSQQNLQVCFILDLAKIPIVLLTLQIGDFILNIFGNNRSQACTNSQYY